MPSSSSSGATATRCRSTAGRELLHVVRHHVRPPVEQRRRLRHLEQRHAAARRGAQREHRRRPRGPDDRRDVGDQARLHPHPPHRVAQAPARPAPSATRADPVARRQVRLEPAEHPLEDPLLHPLLRIAHQHLDHEPVQLRLGQRIGALELDGVLGREDGEALGQRVRRAVHGHPALLHRLEQRGLGLGGRTVDLVAQDQVAEDRSRPEA